MIKTKLRCPTISDRRREGIFTLFFLTIIFVDEQKKKKRKKKKQSYLSYIIYTYIYIIYMYIMYLNSHSGHIAFLHRLRQVGQRRRKDSPCQCSRRWLRKRRLRPLLQSVQAAFARSNSVLSLDFVPLKDLLRSIRFSMTRKRVRVCLVKLT